MQRVKGCRGSSGARGVGGQGVCNQGSRGAGVKSVGSKGCRGQGMQETRNTETARGAGSAGGQMVQGMQAV